MISSIKTEQKNRRPKAEHLVNEAIPFQKIFILDQNGEKIGVMSKMEAIEKAKSSGYDLVIISDNPQQPVAKILDYGKFKYERQKKRKEVKAKQVIIENKEIRLTPMIGDHDLMTKSRKAREFLEKGDRVKISLKFRGREIIRQDLGRETLNRFYKSLEDIAKMEKQPVLLGKFLDMFLVKDKSKTQSNNNKENKNAENEN